MKYSTVFLTFVLLYSLCWINLSFSQKATAEFITSISPPTVSDTISIKDGERFVTYKNNKLFIVNYWTGIQIIDVTDVSSPRKLSFINTRDRVHKVLIDNNMLYAANEGEGIKVFDISDIFNPKKLAEIKTPGNALWIDANYPYLYVAMGTDGFSVMDISNLNDPRTLSLEIPGSWIWSIKYRENKIYAAAKRGGIFIYDVSNPESLKKLTQFKTDYQAIQFAFFDNLAYVADGPGGLLILDISVPELPKKLGRFPSKGFCTHVFKSGNYAYVSNRELGLLIVNVSDPENPYLEGSYTPESETYCAYKEDVYLFLVTDTKTEILRHNNQPVLEPIADIKIDENSSYMLQLKASDVDGDAIEFEAVNLPEGSQFNSENGLFTWIPSYEQAGLFPGVIFRATEKTGSKLSDSDTIDITVVHVNRLPDLPSLPNITAPEDSSISIQVLEGSDPDKEDESGMTYSAENLPEGAVFNPVSRLFTWQPTFDQSGVYVIDFVLRDGAGGADREAVTFTVQHVDRPPIIQKIENQLIAENEYLEIQLQGNEPDKEDLNKINYSMLNIPQGANFDAVTALFSWTPGYDQSGVYANLTAIMSAGAFADSSSFTITVNHVNRPPVLNEIGDKTVDENSILEFKVGGSDPDVEDTGNINLTAENLPTGAIFDQDSLKFTWKPTYEQSGNYSGINFTITDPQEVSDEESISITVNHVNRTPLLANVPPKTIDENTPLEYQLTGTDPDKEDMNNLVYSAQGLPEGAVLDPATGNFNWTPTFEQSGVYDINFSISDGFINASKSTAITVNHVNRAPVLEDIINKTVDENQVINFVVNGIDPDREDEGKLTFSTDNIPEGAVFDAVSHTFSWTPTFEQSGHYQNIIFRITDPQGLTDQKSMSIFVRQVNRPPILEPVTAIVSEEQELVSFTLKGSDPDKEDKGFLRYNISNIPDGAVLNQKTGAFTWTPGYDQSGSFELDAQVADSAGLTAQFNIPITVTNVNRSPVVESLTDISGAENSPLNFQLKFSDPDEEDQGKLSLNVTGLPDGAKLDENSGNIAWMPNFDQNGEYKIDYTITDTFGSIASGSVKIQITNVNRLPVLDNIGDKNVKEGETLSFTISASDADTEDQGKLKYSADGLPAGATFDGGSGTFSWTPRSEQQGDYNVTFKVSDSSGDSDQKTIGITVEDVPPPQPEPEN